MPPPRAHRGQARQQSFVLLEAPEDGRARLIEADEHHARRVLRVGTGDELEGLDGQGRAWSLRVRGVDELGLSLEVLGDARSEPRPGSPGAELPRLQLLSAWPQGKRGEALLSAVVGLGVSRVTPLICEHSPPSARRESAHDRLEHLVREACKVSGRLWFPRVDEPTPFEDALEEPQGAETLLLDRGAQASLAAVVQASAARGVAAYRLLVGPQGGFSSAERERAQEAGALPVALGRQLLRIEHAAMAGVSVALHTWWAQRAH